MNDRRKLLFFVILQFDCNKAITNNKIFSKRKRKINNEENQWLEPNI